MVGVRPVRSRIPRSARPIHEPGDANKIMGSEFVIECSRLEYNTASLRLIPWYAFIVGVAEKAASLRRERGGERFFEGNVRDGTLTEENLRRRVNRRKIAAFYGPRSSAG